MKGRDRVAINKRNYDVSSSEFSRLCKEGFYIETHPYKLWYESNKTWFFLQAYVLSMAAKKGIKWEINEPLSYYLGQLDDKDKEEVTQRVSSLVEDIYSYLESKKASKEQARFLLLWNTRQFAWLGLLDKSKRDDFLRRKASLFASHAIDKHAPIMVTNIGKLLVGQTHLVFSGHDEKTNLAQALCSAFSGKTLSSKNSLVDWVKESLLDVDKYFETSKRSSWPPYRGHRQAIQEFNKISFDDHDFNKYYDDWLSTSDTPAIQELVYADRKKKIFNRVDATSVPCSTRSSMGSFDSYFDQPEDNRFGLVDEMHSIKNKLTNQHIDLLRFSDGSYQVCVSVGKQPYSVATAIADYFDPNNLKQWSKNIQQDRQRASSK